MTISKNGEKTGSVFRSRLVVLYVSSLPKGSYSMLQYFFQGKQCIDGIIETNNDAIPNNDDIHFNSFNLGMKI